MAGIFFKLLFKAMVPLLIVLGGLSYMSYLQGNNPMDMLVAPFKGGNSSNTHANSSVQKEPVAELRSDLDKVGSLTKVYRWRDAEGNQHFGDRPPQQKVKVETMEINPDANLILGLEMPEPKKPTEQTTASSLDNPYKPENIKKLFDDANKLKETLNQRNQIQQELLGH